MSANREDSASSFSGHEIWLKLDSVEQLTVRVPWPFFFFEEWGFSFSKKKKKWIVHINFCKSLTDAWPSEYGGRSKWDIDRLKPWANLVSNGSLQMHIDAQFDCDYVTLRNWYSTYWNNMLSSETFFKFEEKLFAPCKTLSQTHRVREMIGAIFSSHCDNSFYLFAIFYDDVEENPNDSILYLRVHPPVKFSPQGSPLLLMSVVDLELTKQLIEDGELVAEDFESDFHRVITERVSREVCNIHSRFVDGDSFQYVLRVNSTKMRRNTWQSKNLPRNGPFMATFISPLYVESISNQCHLLDKMLASLEI